MRTTIDLPDDQIRALKDYCGRKGVSRAEAIRQAVDKLVQSDEEEAEQRREIMRASIGIWPDHRDAREIVDELRAEWDHRP